jgi:hypothetical protein
MKLITNNYVKTPASSKRHNTPTEEITAAFLAVGWIGERRQRPNHLYSARLFWPVATTSQHRPDNGR